MTCFDLVAVVDWSASSAPPKVRPQADAIWVGLASSAGVTSAYHPSRHAAEVAIKALILQALAKRQSLLLGFDFPMGYPDGFAARLTGQASAPAVWRWLADAITDGPDNRNNRFAVADAINRDFGGWGASRGACSGPPASPLSGPSASPSVGPSREPSQAPSGGPFWGRPDSLPLPHLPARKTVNYVALGLEERRRVEKLVPRAQPVWKLFTTGAAGSQSLMGLPMIHRLAQLPVAVWPFAAPAPVTLAEIYPSLLAPAVTAALAPGGIKDDVQVRLLAQALWRLGQNGALADLLSAPPPEVRREEGWILGAGAAARLMAAL